MRVQISGLSLLLNQRQGEIVITDLNAYHQRLSVGPTHAEAVNYAGKYWSIDDYPLCIDQCLKQLITQEPLQFKRSNGKREKQGALEGEGNEEAPPQCKKVRITNRLAHGVTRSRRSSKSGLANLDVYSPNNEFDYRVGINLEANLKGNWRDLMVPMALHVKSSERRKDRMSFKHLAHDPSSAYQIDLTQVKAICGLAQPQAGKRPLAV
ncbi:mRNA-capping enzyme subunit beta [Lobaria immixta]|nr:mRNA-capping enzyme subunit beta [Lobaria immixta]